MSTYYSGDGLGLGTLNRAADQSGVVHPLANLGQPQTGSRYGTLHGLPGGVSMALWVAGLASVPVLAYHGYKRNRSVGWALVWGIFGSWVWPITVPVAFAQGYAKPHVRRNRRRRRTSRRTSRRS